MILGRASPADLLAPLVAVLNESDQRDQRLCSEIGCGDLESLPRDNETQLWPAVERLARTDARFRRALSSVWAYDPPEFERREALLAELGEHREILVRFAVEPEDFAADPVLSWRGFEADGNITNTRLVGILRELAEWLDRRVPDAEAGSS